MRPEPDPGRGKCIHGFLHDWRHLEATVEYVYPEIRNEDDPRSDEIVTTDVWYCTRCRKIESTTREE